MALTIEDELRGLLACLCTALGEAGWVGECCIQPGQVAFDNCCEDGGQAWVRLIELYPTQQFPLRGFAVDPTDPDATWAMSVELGALTCVCVESCGCEQLEADTVRVLALVDAALQAIACCGDGSSVVSRDVRVFGLTVVGPDGGCGGFTLNAIIPWQVCCPSD